ncbi:MAG: hypothetical protein FJ196_06230 [Gammaproteobacteria bacterium]|nr:hypothetical protein [Gammaproteobacteria bacterium]
MPKNRQYTNLERTPPSMAWLISERAKLKGMLERRQKQLEDLPGEIVDLQAKLDALDAVIPLHEVKVDPKAIKGKREKVKAIGPYGLMTKVIYRVLKEAEGKPCLSTEIAIEFIREAGLAMTRANKVYITLRVSCRLKSMVRKGQVVRHHSSSVGANDEGLWSLPKDGWARDDEDDHEPLRKAA